MILFLLFSVPLTHLIILTGFNNEGIKKRVLAAPVLIGMVVSIPFYLLYWSLLSTFFNDWTFSGVYLSHFLKKDGAATLYLLGFLILIFFINRNTRKGSGSKLRELSAYSAGFLFTLSLYDTLIFQKWYGFSELFLLPLDRISVLLLFSVLPGRYLDGINWTRYLWLAAAAAVPFIMNIIPAVYSSGSTFGAIILSLLFLTISLFLFLLEKKLRQN